MAVAQGSSRESAPRTVRFQQQTLPLSEVVRVFTEPDPRLGYLGRIPPFAYVAAEMLGAKLNILAVYQSAATRDTTHHSYFAVHKDRFGEKTKWTPESGAASLDDVDHVSQELSGRAREISVPRPVQHIELLHTVALLQERTSVRDESAGQPASHPDRRISLPRRAAASS